MAPSLTQLLIVLAIVVLLFGTKKLRGIGSDLGSAIKSFKKEVSKEEPETDTEAENEPASIQQKTTAKDAESVKKNEKDKV